MEGISLEFLTKGILGRTNKRYLEPDHLGETEQNPSGILLQVPHQRPRQRPGSRAEKPVTASTVSQFEMPFTSPTHQNAAPVNIAASTQTADQPAAPELSVPSMATYVCNQL